MLYFRIDNYCWHQKRRIIFLHLTSYSPFASSLSPLPEEGKRIIAPKLKALCSVIHSFSHRVIPSFPSLSMSLSSRSSFFLRVFEYSTCRLIIGFPPDFLFPHYPAGAVMRWKEKQHPHISCNLHHDQICRMRGEKWTKIVCKPYSCWWYSSSDHNDVYYNPEAVVSVSVRGKERNWYAQQVIRKNCCVLSILSPSCYSFFKTLASFHLHHRHDQHPHPYLSFIIQKNLLWSPHRDPSWSSSISWSNLLLSSSEKNEEVKVYHERDD